MKKPATDSSAKKGGIPGRPSVTKSGAVTSRPSITDNRPSNVSNKASVTNPPKTSAIRRSSNLKPYVANSKTSSQPKTLAEEIGD